MVARRRAARDADQVASVQPPGFLEVLYRQFIQSGSPVPFGALDGGSLVYAAAMVARMMARDPGDRLTRAEALGDHWFDVDIAAR